MKSRLSLSATIAIGLILLVGGGYAAFAKTEIVITPLVESEASVNPAIEIATELATDGVTFDTIAAQSGIAIGSEIARSLITPDSQAGTDGISIAQDFAEANALFRGRFVTELELLKRLTLLARLDPWEALQEISNRTEAVRQLERDYADTIAAGEAAKAQVVIVGNDISAQIDSLEQEIEATETEFFDAFGDFEAERAAEKYDGFVEKKQKLVVLRAEFGRYKALNDRFNTVLPAAEVKQIAITRNREALIEGVQVDKDTAVRAGVVKENPAE